jgi:2-polyprenyl-3-methyl-5-hydroxy-6-metoxy-1,4-benzoquinol methylase
MTIENTEAGPGVMNVDTLMQMATGFQPSSIIRTALDMGVFENLDKTADDIATAIEASPRGTRILLDALAALAVIHRRGDRYEHSEVSRMHLVSDSPAFVGGSIRLFSSDMIWNGMRGLADSVRQGGTCMEEHAETPDHPFWQDFARWTTGMAAAGGASVVGALAEHAGDRSTLRVLDVACGSGMYGYSVAAAYEHAAITSLDWPSVLPLAAANAERMGLSDRVTQLPGNMFEVEVDHTFDVVIMSHVFHHFDEATCITLMRRASSWLADGGQLVIHDFIPAAEPASEPFPYLFSTMMLTWTHKGRSYHRDEYQRMLAEAELSEVASLPVAGGSHLLVASRG